MKSLCFLLLFLGCISLGECACTFPTALLGVFESSSLKPLNFSSSQTVTIKSIHTFGDMDFQCDTKSGSKYILRAASTTLIFNTQMEATTCLDITEITPGAKYLFTQATTQSSSAGNARIKFKPAGSALTEAAICDETTPYPDGTYELMIKNDSLAAASITCPSMISSIFSYTIDGNCYSNSSLDVCTNDKQLSFDYSICSSAVGYSSGGDLTCVYSNVYNGLTYLTLYNNDANVDESSTFRFTCFVMTLDGNVVNGTQHPQVCLAAQTANSVASPGQVFQLTTSSACAQPTTTTASPGAEELGTASVAAGTTIGIIAVLALVFLLLFFLVFRKGAPYPIKDGKCKKFCGCAPLLYCLSCQCCCPKRAGRGARVDPEDIGISTDNIGEASQDETQVTGNGREVDVIPAPTPPGAKDITELQKMSSSGEDDIPRRLPPIDASSRDETEDTSAEPSKLPAIEGENTEQTAEAEVQNSTNETTAVVDETKTEEQDAKPTEDANAGASKE